MKWTDVMPHLRLRLLSCCVTLPILLIGLLPAGFAYSSSIQLPRTWLSKCYDTFGSEVVCLGTGQDADTQTGVEWPLPRFANKGNGTVKDRLTGLFWIRNIYTPTVGSCTGGKMPWIEAFSYVDCLNSMNYGDRSDWRVPNINEMRSIVRQIPPGNLFASVRQIINYMTSTTYAGNPDYVLNSRDAFPKDFFMYVLPVAGVTVGAASLPRTNQEKSYAPGDDGSLRMGVPWPTPRFTDNVGDHTVTDNLTGLVWTKNAATPGPSACRPRTGKTWQGALDLVRCLNSENYLGRSTWRLPNINELASLLDVSQYFKCLPSDNPFTEVRQIEYWSSSTDVHLNGDKMAGRYALAVNMMTCSVHDADKDNKFVVWPVSSL